jgi:YggT family protein
VTGWMYLYYLLELVKWLVIIRVVMSWFVSPYSRNPVVEVVRRITDPILRPVASLVPNMGGIDISPLVVFFLIIILQRVIVQAAYL